MSKHPYSDPAPWRLWRRSVAAPAVRDVDPLVSFPFGVSGTDRIVTAGSCFAQHIGRHLAERGYNHFITEPAHSLLDNATAAEFGYGVYSARYGNIYSARQLLQLFQRAHGHFVPAETPWEEDGRVFDPFRPVIQPRGFASRAEFQIDQAQHFAAVRRAFAELDVFVFTFGLTECWESTLDGAVFPLCPGVAHGDFDAGRYRFRNLSVQENIDDMAAFLNLLRGVNPGARVILTVSPVPLIATAMNQHVLAATTYSKSVLRVAAETLSRSDRVGYFPAYEIVTGAFSRGGYFADDCRSVTETGVAHVMRCFFSHVTDSGDPPCHAAAEDRKAPFEGGAAIVQSLCEEESLDPGR